MFRRSRGGIYLPEDPPSRLCSMFAGGLLGLGAGPAVGLTIFTPSVAGDYVGETAAQTFGSGSVTWGATDDALRSNAITFAGDFILQADINDIGGRWGWGAYPISEDATFNKDDAQGYGDLDLMTNSWWFQQSEDGTTIRVRHAGVQKATFTAASGDTFKIDRVGTTLKAYHNGSLKHTWTETSSAELRPAMGNANLKGDITNMTWQY